MAILGTFTKQPQEVLDYDIDFSEFLPTTDTIAAINVTADAGITVLSSAGINDFKAVKVWISEGVSGSVYKIQVRITSGDGRVKEAEFKIKVKEV